MNRLPIVVLLAAALAVAGCVSERVYQGTDKVVPEAKKDPSQAALARVSLGMKYLQSGSMELAKDNLVRALEMAPDLAAASYGLAYYYQQVKEHDRAHHYYREAIRLEPANGDVRNAFGAYLCELQEYDEAIAQFEAAVSSLNYTRVAETYENMGLCARRWGDNDKAYGYFKKALSHSGLRARSLLEAARLELERSDIEAADKSLALYHRHYPVSASSAFLAVRLAKILHDPLAMKQYGDILTNQFPASEEAKNYVLDQF